MLEELARRWETTPDRVIELALVYLYDNASPMEPEVLRAMEDGVKEFFADRGLGDVKMEPWTSLDAPALNTKMKALAALAI